MLNVVETGHRRIKAVQNYVDGSTTLHEPFREALEDIALYL
jgi:hypothetical protein